MDSESVWEIGRPLTGHWGWSAGIWETSKWHSWWCQCGRGWPHLGFSSHSKRLSQGSALCLRSGWEADLYLHFSLCSGTSLRVCSITPNVGKIEEETNRDLGSGVFSMNPSTWGTFQMLRETSLNRSNSIFLLDPPPIRLIALGKSRTSCSQRMCCSFILFVCIEEFAHTVSARAHLFC